MSPAPPWPGPSAPSPGWGSGPRLARRHLPGAATRVPGREVASSAAADLPPRGFPGGSPAPAGRQLPPPPARQGGPVRPATYRLPGSRRAPWAALQGQQPQTPRGPAQPSTRRPGLSPSSRSSLAREHVSSKRAPGRRFPTAARRGRGAAAAAASPPAIDARPALRRLMERGPDRPRHTPGLGPPAALRALLGGQVAPGLRAAGQRALALPPPPQTCGRGSRCRAPAPACGPSEVTAFIGTQQVRAEASLARRADLYWNQLANPP